MSTGTIKRMVKDKGFGFIEPADKSEVEQGKDLFFHTTAVVDGSFDSLNEGQQVSYVKGDGPKGPQATEVKPM
ncbi:MAG: cold shock domain-containing protein [Patescibacteria group bacterium]